MMQREIHGHRVYGVDLDAESRCGHWNSPLDIIAIKFKCCGRYYSCFDCHVELAGHRHEVWARNEFSEPAVICGACGHQLTVDDYLNCRSVCPGCGSQFNPGCAGHYHLYFEQ